MAKKRATSKKRKTKVSKNSAAKSRAAKSAVNKPAAAKKTNDTGALNKLHVLSLIVYALLIAGVVVFMKKTNIDVTLPYVTKDPLNEAGGLVAASRHFYTVDLRVLVIAALGLSLVLPVLYLTKLKNYYQSAISRGFNSVHWFDSALVGAVMLEVVAILSGWTDIITLKLFIFSVFVLGIFGWLREKHVSETKADDARYEVVTNLTSLFIVALLAFTSVTSIIYGLNFNSWYVYILYAGVVGALIAYGTNCHRVVRQGYIKTERNNLILNILTRFGFAIVLIVGLMK